MSVANIYSFNNQELVSFLQKVGQHEAAKVVQKYEMNGEVLKLLPNQNEIELTDCEKNILIRCIKLIELNPLSSVQVLKVVDVSPDLEEKHSIDPTPPSIDIDTQNSNDHFKINHEDTKETRYFKLHGFPRDNDIPVTNTNKQRRSSAKYFIFSKRENLEVKQFSGDAEDFEDSRMSTVSSSGYIDPHPAILVPRHQEIIVDRIKKYVRAEDIIRRQDHHQYEVILPNEVVIHSKNTQNDTERKNSILCDFLLNLCCFSCSIGCRKKQ